MVPPGPDVIHGMASGQDHCCHALNLVERKTELDGLMKAGFSCNRMKVVLSFYRRYSACLSPFIITAMADSRDKYHNYTDEETENQREKGISPWPCRKKQ